MTGQLPDALARCVDDDIADVVAQARQRAMARVTEQLVDAYADVLLARMNGPAIRQRSTANAGATERRGCYLYAVVAGAGTGAVTAQQGVQGREVKLLRVGALCALVSAVDVDALAALSAQEEPLAESSPLAVAVRAHDDVVDAAFRAGAVIPLRFGTVVADEDAATELVRAHADELRAELHRVSNAAEWTVKLAVSSGEPENEAELDPAGAAAATGRDYLTALGRDRKARTDVRRRVDEAATAAHLSLCELAMDSARGPAGADGVTLKASYLVPREAGERFVQHCEQLHESLAAAGLCLEFSGPWPAYHFVDVRLGERAP